MMRIGIIFCLVLLSACSGTWDKLSQVGKEPPLNKIENPIEQEEYKPISWPTPIETKKPEIKANSLWRSGAKTFFRDQRASRVGDILRVKVVVDDKAEIDNETSRTRGAKEGMSADSVFGIENKLVSWIPGAQDTTNLLEVGGDSESSGSGSIKRDESIETEIAAMVTQVLPNGNLVIYGRQEVRVNFEVREIAIQGVVRPEDISHDNIIESTQIAEARISYGGRGQITDMQQPRPGYQVIDILSPF